MRKFVVIITLLYIAAVAAALGYLSDWFREGLALGESVIATTLVLSVIAAVIVAVIAYWKDNEWLAVVLVAIILGFGWYVGKTHHQAYGKWFPSFASKEVEKSGTAKLSANGQEISYRLELHNPGTVTHREYLVVTRGGKDQRIRLPIFDEARSGYVSAKTPSDWIVLHPTTETGVFRAETGQFLFVRKSFRVNLGTGKAMILGKKSP
jgi:MFS family permease